MLRSYQQVYRRKRRPAPFLTTCCHSLTLCFPHDPIRSIRFPISFETTAPGRKTIMETIKTKSIKDFDPSLYPEIRWEMRIPDETIK